MAKKQALEARLEAISFRQLRLFESIGRLQSVRRASEDCNLSQPAVTQSLSKLEELVGAKLVERRANGSYLNEPGQRFHRRATRFLDQLSDALAAFGVENPRAISARIPRSQVRALIAVAETGSFAQAAAELRLSAATVQRAARDLEGNVHKPLFFRTADGTIPTPEATALGRRLKLCLQEVDWGVRELAESRGEPATPIVVGAMPLGGTLLLASMLDDFIRREPAASIVIRNESAVEMLRSLRAGDVDFIVGLVPWESAGDLSAEAFLSTPYSIVARAGHPLLSRSRVTRESLAQYDWLIGAAGSSRRTCFNQLFDGLPGVHSQIATSAVSVIRHLLVRSDRLTLLTSYELQHEGQELARIPFGPISPVPAIGVTTRANWLPTRQHAAFLQMLRDHVAATLLPQPKTRRGKAQGLASRSAAGSSESGKPW
jgi:DNA-binding transcriptional LysR family regulator